MNHFQFIPLKTPSSGCEGIATIRSDSNDLFVLWHGKEVILYDICAINRKNSIPDVLTLNSDIVNVFQLYDSVCCLGSDATLYRLCKTGRSISQKSYERGDEDLFESGDSADEYVKASEYYFVSVITLNNVVNICPVTGGFVIVQETFGKLFIEVFSVTKCFTKTERSHSKEISYIPPKILHNNECIVVAVKQQKMARDLMSILIRDMAVLDIEIIFIAFKSGQVFYVPNTKTSHLPKLLYSSVHPVADVMFLQGGTDMKLVIALEPGLLVEVRSSDKRTGQLEYVSSCLPGTIRVACVVGSHILAGDHNHLWCWQPETCKKSRNDSDGAGSGPQIRELAVRGVTHICCLGSSGDALVITFQTSKDGARVDQMVWIRVGKNLCKLIVNSGYTAIELQSKEPVTLHCIKKCITEEMVTACRHSQEVKIPIAVVDVAQSIRMNLDIERAQPTIDNLEVLRKQWRTSVTEKLPS